MDATFYILFHQGHEHDEPDFDEEEEAAPVGGPALPAIPPPAPAPAYPHDEVSCTSDRQKTSKFGRIGNLLQSVLAEVLCLHRGVVKKEVAVLCRVKEDCCGSLPGEGRLLRFSAGGRKRVLCHHQGVVKKEVLRFSAEGRKRGSLPSPRSGEKGSVAVLCRRKEEGFSAITV
ncbi:hypothetical protein M5K25_021093 [Dendrobium thyrsiflorum]|uniref:Uncharacterized protein n=1 Tax=Dendrobium thyrsiflorum TaxID=117978 RepID=A0ABD0UBR0_DENTH